MKKILKQLKKLDIQGYQISLNYKGKGNNHQTYLGGFVCAIVFMSILSSTYHKTHDMLFHGNDSILNNEVLMTVK